MVTPLTASKILALDAGKNLEVVTIGTSLNYTRPTLNTIQNIRTIDSPTFANLNLTEAEVNDPTLLFTSATNSLKIYLDESTTNDTFVVEGQTAAKVTNLYVKAIDGYNSVLALYSGDNKTNIYKSSTDDTYISNLTLDADIIFQINDGGVTKSITWDADVDKLKHSHGLFDFDDDNIRTTGAISSGTLTFSTEGPTDNVDVSGINTLLVDTSSNSVTIGGLAGGVDGQVLYVARTSNANNVVIEHNEGGATQPILLHAGADETLGTEYGGWVLVCHGGTDWHDCSHAKHVV